MDSKSFVIVDKVSVMTNFLELKPYTSKIFNRVPVCLVHEDQHNRRLLCRRSDLLSSQNGKRPECEHRTLADSAGTW